ncbi:hypothetical protein DN745_00455 [Bradymonas sediminis]|uniref:Uncharacterized protein n=1 Tax=Bradymonas sediminis TaxID=1548548 RepID=A0A2Z4FG45_9DELT|nr:hypothetical protein DN745_00455 [Bradymonas sediminis]
MQLICDLPDEPGSDIDLNIEGTAKTGTVQITSFGNSFSGIVRDATFIFPDGLPNSHITRVDFNGTYVERPDF